MSYYFSKVLTVSFDEAVDRVTQTLKGQGFGVITEIDVFAKITKIDGQDKSARARQILGFTY